MGGALHLGSGTTLGRYELVLKVASGGMGEVWAARLKREHGYQQLFAIKVLRPELAEDPALQRMFLDEAEVAARIRHPNVVQGVDRGQYRGTPYLVMEWVAGEPLSAALRGAAGRPAPALVAARIAYQICAGLESAHELCDDDGRPLGLVHCDVSPENVLITSEGLVRLVDFGVALYGGPPLSERSGLIPIEAWVAAPPSSGQRGELRGKAPYMAPEHILGAPSDRRADLFAVGILLYEMLAGTHPFLADDDQITMTRIASDYPLAPISSRPRARLRVPAPSGPPVPPALEHVVLSALARAPERRFQTAGALMQALDEAVPGAALPSSDHAVAQWLHEVLGEALQLRARKLREALEAVEHQPRDRRRMPRCGSPSDVEPCVYTLAVTSTEASGVFPSASGIFPSPVRSRAVALERVGGVERAESAVEAPPESRREGPVSRGARAGTAMVVAAVTCALFGSATTGDSNIPPPALDRDPPSSREGGAPRSAARPSLDSPFRPATHTLTAPAHPAARPLRDGVAPQGADSAVSREESLEEVEPRGRALAAP
ncbi:serine/threonine-protein kinase [Chondromyces crocatus]|uniref:Protein kinase domain-containing protein n=1 Tax=Chondromyces crocatus TaxID=52 RepID=A0A0K1EQW6_CHOCO|nr:serine/threonine-protein kinase [Chondromyces crocatus]AKT43231.1 uncharacterized protein CMC5_074620 [Chondromyces crocatus]